LHTRGELRTVVQQARAAGRTIGVVPTMGALHAGHASLVEAACRECDFVIVTVFVNPTQFGPNEDFQKYPRTLDADIELLADLPVDVIYAPAASEMYPNGFATFVEVGGSALPLEGAKRPDHFRGVATVVLKLFAQTSADVAYFGQKDFQQTRVVRQMVRDFDLPVRIQVCPTVREPDGLALSSRNAYLAATDRSDALVLSRSLKLARELIYDGERSSTAILARLHALYEAVPGVKLDYLVIADPETLAVVDDVRGSVVVAVAARVGVTRLIDNELIRIEADALDQETSPP
jgi:pantoate--beta-alanine ligase